MARIRPPGAVPQAAYRTRTEFVADVYSSIAAALQDVNRKRRHLHHERIIAEYAEAATIASMNAQNIQMPVMRFGYGNQVVSHRSNGSAAHVPAVVIASSAAQLINGHRAKL